MGKRETLEDTWEKIAQEAIAKAEKVSCPMEDFLDGLKDIATTILDRRAMG